MAAPEDLNVDELKRRARRRLVGAIVLALAVAVLVPMLLESDPKPLGEDVSVKIPPIDEGKFVNRLSEKGKAEPAKTAAAKTEPPKTESRSEPVKAETEKAAPPPAATEAAPKAEPAKEEPPKSEPAPSAPPQAAEPVTTAKAPSSPPPTPPHEPAAGEFSVQVFAFSDDKGANSLVNKLKKVGFPAYTEPVNTSRGTLWRVRVGPYPSRESAFAAREKLKGEGYNGIVAAAK